MERSTLRIIVLEMPLHQLLPFTAFKLGLPLKWILILYSVSPVLLFGLIYHLLVKWLRNDALGWVLIFYLILISFDSFYYIQSGIYMGMALTLLVFGIVTRYPDLRKGWQLLLTGVLLLFIANFHKTAIAFFPIPWLFFWLHQPRLRHGRYIGILAFFLISGFLLGRIFQSPYEAHKLSLFQQALEDYFPNFWDMPANWKFAMKCGKYYYFLPFLFLLNSAFYFLKKKWLKLGWMVLAFFGFLILLHYASPHTTYRFYAEISYLSLTIILTLPLFFDVLPAWKDAKILPWLLTGIVLLRLGTIVSNSATFSKRLDWYEAQLESKESRILLPVHKGSAKHSVSILGICPRISAVNCSRTSRFGKNPLHQRTTL